MYCVLVLCFCIVLSGRLRYPLTPQHQIKAPHLQRLPRIHCLQILAPNLNPVRSTHRGELGLHILRHCFPGHCIIVKRLLLNNQRSTIRNDDALIIRARGRLHLPSHLPFVFTAASSQVILISFQGTKPPIAQWIGTFFSTSVVKECPKAWICRRIQPSHLRQNG